MIVCCWWSVFELFCYCFPHTFHIRISTKNGRGDEKQF